jgi:hypothetical protein
VQRLDKNVDFPDAPPWSAVGLMAGLGHLLTDSVRSEWIQELAETPEGHALLTMPDRLARRLIPEMAASILARRRTEAT